MTQQWWGEPTAGEIVWCHFPDNIHPRPKPRPALILAVFDDNAPQFDVRVAYGTSQRTTSLHRGEFAILQDRNAAAYTAAGLSYDTKFDLRQVLDLPYTSDGARRGSSIPCCQRVSILNAPTDGNRQGS